MIQERLTILRRFQLLEDPRELEDNLLPVRTIGLSCPTPETPVTCDVDEDSAQEIPIVVRKEIEQVFAVTRDPGLGHAALRSRSSFRLRTELPLGF
jgi:hypothetical protein